MRMILTQAKRILTGVMAAALIVTSVPMSAFAEPLADDTIQESAVLSEENDPAAEEAVTVTETDVSGESSEESSIEESEDVEGASDIAEEPASEEPAIAEQEEPETDLLSGDHSEFTVNIGDYDGYSINPASENSGIVEEATGDPVTKRYFIESTSARSILVEIKFDEYHKMGPDGITATINGSNPANVIAKGDDIYSIENINHAIPINGNVAISVDCQPITYTHTIIADDGVKSVTLDSGTTTNVQKEANSDKVIVTKSKDVDNTVICLSAAAVDDYAIESITVYDDSGESPVYISNETTGNGRFKLSGPDNTERNLKYEIKSHRSIYHIPVTLNYADSVTVNWGPYSNTIDRELEDGKINFNAYEGSGNLYLDITPKEGYEKPQFYECFKDNTKKQLTADLLQGNVYSFTVKKADLDVLDHIEISPSKKPAIPVSAKINGKTSVGKYDITIDGVDANGNATNEKVSLTIKLDNTKERVKYASYTAGGTSQSPLEATPVIEGDTATYVYEISAANVKSCWLSELPIVFVINTEETARKTITVSYDSGITGGPVLSIDGAIVMKDWNSSTSTLQTDTYYISSSEQGKITVTASAAADYKLSKISINGNEQPDALKNGTVTFTADKDETAVLFNTTGAPTIHMGDKIIADKAKVALGAYEKTSLTVMSGEDKLDVNVETNIDGGGFAVVNSDGKTVDIDAAKANAAGKQNIAVKLVYEGGFQTVNFSIAKAVSAVTLKGAKVTDKATGDAAITLAPGASGSYAITVKKGEDLGRVLDAKLLTEPSDVNAVLKIENGKLYIYNYKGGKLNTGDFTFRFMSGETQLGGKFTVKIPEPLKEFAAPTVKISAISDTYMDMSLTLPKGMDAYSTDNLYYVINAKAVTDPAESSPMKKEVTRIIPATTGSYRLFLTDAESMNGTAQKYNISVRIALLDDKTKYDDYSEKLNDGASFCLEGKEKTINNQSTKAPAYETKLSLTKKTTSFIQGETDILIATAKFSKNTSCQEIASTTLYYSFGETVYSNPVQIKGSNLYIANSSSLQPGSYTLKVTPKTASAAYAAPATLSITVKSPVSGIEFKMPSYTIYKQAGKSATMKITATALGAYPSIYTMGSIPTRMKPANNKLEYEITNCSDTLRKYVTINKKGTITVAKNYIIDPNDCTFTVTAKSTDPMHMTRSTGTITITNKASVPTQILIGNVEGKSKPAASDAHLSADLEGKKLIVTDADKYAMDTDSLSISVSPKTGLTISPESGTVNVSKTGTYTVKVTTTDGSKKSLSAKFIVKSDELNESDPYRIVIRNARSTGEPDILSFTDGETTVEDSTLLFVSVDPNPAHEGAIVNTKGVSVSFNKKEAKSVKMAYNPLEQYRLKAADIVLSPVQSASKVTISVESKDKKTKQTFTVKLNRPEGTLTPVDSSVKCYASSGMTETIKFNLKDVTTEEGKKYCLMFLPDEKAYGNINALEKASLMLMPIQAGTGSLTISENTAAFNGMFYPPAVGTYVFNVAIWEYSTVSTGFGAANVKYIKPMTKTAKLTVKVVKAPAASAVLNTTAQLKNASGEATAIGFKSVKNVEDVSVYLYNYVDKNEVSAFTNYFHCSGYDKATQTVKLTLNEKIDDKDITIVKSKGKETKTITGYIGIKLTGPDGRPSDEKVQKVTITLTD